VLMSIFMVAWMVLGWAFLPLFYVKVRQLSAGEMSVLMSLLGLSAAFFSFVVPGLSDRLGRRPVVAGCSLLGLLVPLAALYWHGSLYVLGALIFIGWAASGGLPLRAGTAGVRGRRHGGRVRAGARHGGVREPALGHRRRTRRRELVHSLPQPDAARDHRRTAGALDAAARAVPLLRAGDESAAAVRQVELRAGARRGCAGGSGPRLLHRHAAAPRADLPLGPRG